MLGPESDKHNNLMHKKTKKGEIRKESPESERALTGNPSCTLLLYRFSHFFS